MPFRPGDPKPPGSGRKKGSTARPPTPRAARALVLHREPLEPLEPPEPLDGAVMPPPRTKLARLVAERLEELGLDPITGLCRVGLKAEEAGELGVARLCYSDLAQFVYPRRRAVDFGGQVEVNVNDAGAREALAARIAGIRDRLGLLPPAV